ncbi:uncharacterized protein LOC126804957 isoform X2 [Argentina anserina]|nr:uncharacterized protein LOC126804957 isoform X2 [Potentilla anserina]
MWHLALNVKEDMLSAGVIPNTVTWSSFISASVLTFFYMLVLRLASMIGLFAFSILLRVINFRELLAKTTKVVQVMRTLKMPARATELSEASNPGCLFYRPLQQEDFDFFLKNGEFPSTDSYIQTAFSSDSFCTPPSRERGTSVDCNDLDSVLTSAAMTFKSSPSILRKRKHPRHCLRSELDHVPSEEMSNISRNSPKILSPCGETTFYCKARSNAKKTFSFSSKGSEAIAAYMWV